ncbi:MAG: glycosyltransferase family 39 protein [Planctomycetota bacterium]
MNRRALLLVALVAVLARGSYELGMALDDGPIGTMSRYAMGDERAYDMFAREVAAGTLDRTRAFYQEPLYAWLVGQAYRLAPPPPVPPDADSVVPHAPVHRAIIMLQHGLGVLMAVLVAGLGARCLGPTGGLLAGLFAAVSGPTIFAESMLLKEAAALLLWVVTLHAWLDVLEDRGRRGRRAGILGALLGLGILLRGNTYLLLGLVLASLLLRVGGRRRPGAALLAGVAALVVLSPALVHNLRRGDLVLSTYQSGSNAAIGQPDVPSVLHGLYYEPIHAGHGDAQFEEQDAVAVAEADVGRRLGGREVSAWWWQRVRDNVLARPGIAAARVGLKLLLTFHGAEIPDVKDWVFVRQAVPWLSTPLSDLTWLGPLALLGLIVLPWRHTGLGVARASVLAVMFSLALFYVMGRYRLNAAPGLWILSAGALLAGWRLFTRPASVAKRSCAVLVAGGLVVAGQIGPVPGEQFRTIVWSNLAPLRTYAADAQVSWGNYATVLSNQAALAGTQQEAERAREAAIAACRRSLELAPGYPEGRQMLVRLLDRDTPFLRPRRDQAAEQAWRLALVLEGERTGHPVQDHIDRPLPAVQTLAAFLASRPSLPGREAYVRPLLVFASLRIAEALAEQSGSLEAALVWVEHAGALDTTEPLVPFRRGLVLKRLGRRAEAEAAYLAAQELGLDSAELHNNLGNLQLDDGRIEQAIVSFERALAADPDNAVILRNLERARAQR